MSVQNSTRTGCKDVFRAFLVENAQFDGELEIPCIRPEARIPGKLIPFSKAIHSDDFDAFVHFYDDDCKFEQIWSRPKTYLPVLKRFEGVITPDFSLYRDMPLAMQFWNTYRGKAIGCWLQENGISVIPNVHFSDERSYEFCGLGIASHSTIALGTHGCMKLREERKWFKQGLAAIVERLKPREIIVYGAAPDEVFRPYREQSIEILQFDSEFAASRKAVKA